VFSPDYRTALAKVPATGGTPTPVTTLNAAVGDGGHRYPTFLPDGRHFLFRSDRGGKTAIVAASIDSRETKDIPIDTSGGVQFVPPGFLIYVRNATVVAQRFDPDRLEVSGEPMTIAKASTDASYAQGARMSASNTGVLVISNPVGYDYQLAMFDRSGKLAGTLGPMRTRVAVGQYPRISPDGKRVAVQQFDPKEQNQDLWIGDLASGSFDRFTTNPAQEQMPVWTPDGRSLITATSRGANVNGAWALTIAGGEEQLLLKGTIFPSDVSPDGKWLVFLQRGEATRSDIGILPLSGGRAAGEPRAIVNSAANEVDATLSPDGKWLAYESDLRGEDEVYVRSFAPDGTVSEATLVTNTGGEQPAWSRDGRELYYIDSSAGYASARIMAVPVTTTGGAFRFGAAMLRLRASVFPIRTNVIRDYDVGPDGRFVIGTATVDSRVVPANIVINWNR
jgi:Tol biopolymer transport system component